MKLEYSYCGHIPTDINHITLKRDELKKALKALDKNLSQVSRVTLAFPGQEIYIYHESCSGYKRASDYYYKHEERDQAMKFACSRIKGHKMIQRYVGLYNQILKLLK